MIKKNKLKSIYAGMKKISFASLLLLATGLMFACGGGSGSDEQVIVDNGGSDEDGSGSGGDGSGSAGEGSGLDSAIYGGGPFYFGGQVTMDELKHSGFTTINFWTIHVNSNGDLVYNDQLIVHDGEYVGKETWPAEIASLKVMPTSIERVQFGVASYGVPDFERIQSLIASNGTGPSSILYKNFKALKVAIPSIDAIDFDDESNYHVESAVKFGVMLADLDYKITFAPYTAKSFWADSFEQINSQRPGTVDRVHVQGYAGGAGNQPSSWNALFSGIKVSMGLWSKNGDSCAQGRTPNNVEDEFATWKDNISGGFIWLYDDVRKCNGSQGAAQYASAINKALDINKSSSSRANSPQPAQQSTFVDTNVTLSWQSGFSGQKYKVYLGASTNLTDDDLLIETMQTSVETERLLEDTTYYWRVDQQNANGNLTGEIWSFSTKIAGMAVVDRTDNNNVTVYARGENLPNEGAANVFDNDNDTKWLDFSANTWLEINFVNENQHAVTEYTFTSANDSPGRDPQNWTLSGSIDGITWQVLDTQSGQDFTQRFEKKRYNFDNEVAYAFYQFEISNHGENITQLAEIELIEYIAQ
jgi:hypothetical protein